MLNSRSRVWLATAALCCGYVGIATANADTSDRAVTRLAAGVLMQNRLDAARNWDSFSIGSGQAGGVLSHPLSNFSTNRLIESGASILRGELRDDGQLFLADNKGGALLGNRELTNDGALTRAGRLIDLQGSLSASERGNVTLTAGGGDSQSSLMGNDMRRSAGTKILETGRDDTLVIAPAGYIHSESRSSFSQFHRDGWATVEWFRRHSHSTFLSAQHWDSEDRRHGRHGEDGEHHGYAGHYAGHHGGGPRWNFHDGYEYCDISPSIPEPRSYALMLAGLLMLWAVRRRWKHNARSAAAA